MKRVKVLRAFWYEGKQQVVGSIVEVVNSVFLDVIASNKAQSVPDEPPAPEPEVKTKRTREK